MQLKNDSRGEAPVAAMWRFAYAAAIASGRARSVAITEADQAVAEYKNRFEDKIRPEPTVGEQLCPRPIQKGCAHCGEDGPFFTPEEVVAFTKGEYTWDNVCKWCRCSVEQDARPVGVLYQQGPTNSVLKQFGYILS